MKIQGTKTEKNLREAFKAEAKANMLYTLFADEVDEDIVEEIYLETAKNEKEHAEVFAEYLGLLGDTKENLKLSIANESFEATIDYPEMAHIARQEGFEEIALKFEMIARIEKDHRDKFADILKKIETNTLYKRPQKQTWQCMECGYVHEGLEPPKECPVCGHDTDDFMLKVSRI